MTGDTARQSPPPGLTCDNSLVIQSTTTIRGRGPAIFQPDHGKILNLQHWAQRAGSGMNSPPSARNYNTTMDIVDVDPDTHVNNYLGKPRAECWRYNVIGDHIVERGTEKCFNIYFVISKP